MLLGVALDQFDLLVRATRLAQVVERVVVDGKEAHRGAVLGTHVGQRRPVGQRHARHAGAEVFDELTHHALRAECFGHRQHKVGRRNAGLPSAGEF